ncbi:MAG: sulfite exporter TauE/SafE family protein [Anaerolineae bacterium]|nr:sulfite exporter TauE/SafE family protein [Anaerolineae bacterium]
MGAWVEEGVLAWYLYVAVVAAGFAAGFINTLAGSGSLITLPLLIFIGLPATVANATNRVGILLQNVVSTGSFHQGKVLDWKYGLMLSVPAVIGSLIGAQIAVNLNEELMRRAIGVVMAIMLFVILFRPNQWLKGRPEGARSYPNLLEILIFFGLGIYGGFIQAGVGIFLLSGLVLASGYDLVRANAIKVLIILLVTIMAMAIFMANSLIDWGVGLLLAVGNMTGAWVACRVAVRSGARFIRWLLIAVVLVSALDLLGIRDLIGRLL